MSDLFEDTKKFDRASLLKGGGALVVAFGLPLGGTAVARAAGERSDATNFGDLPLAQLDSWIKIDSTGKVTLSQGHLDVGTGTKTAWGQMVADELDVPFESVTVIQGDTAITPNGGKSTASNGISLGGQPIVVAAATARQALLNLASAKLGAPVSQLSVTDGVVSVNGNASSKVTYGELIGGRTFNVTMAVNAPAFGDRAALQRGPLVSSSAALKDPSLYKVRGKSIPRTDIPDKVTGKFTYVHNVRVPGMLHGRVIRQPAIGARLLGVDGFRHKVTGVVKVVAQGDFLGVVAKTEFEAIQAAANLKVRWSRSTGLPDYSQVYAATKNSKLIQDVTERNTGDATAAIAGADKVLQATFDTPFNAHAMIGPSAAVADYKSDGTLTIWAGTQWPDGTRTDIAAMLGIPRANVQVIHNEPAGCYGRLGVDDAAADAALLSKAVGQPVRVQWMRQDEHGHAPFNSAATIEIKAGLDKSGKIVGWDYHNWTASHSRGESGNQLAWRAIGGNPDWPRLSGGADAGPYVIGNQRVVSHYMDELLRGVYMRSVGGIQNTFARESMMDDLAAAAGIDPIQFRLNHLTDPRHINVIQTAAKLFGWDSRTSPRKQSGDVVTGRGIATSGVAAYIATIIEVQVNKKTGVVKTTRAAVGFDVGRIINPGTLNQQMEGGTIMGISRAIKEEVKFNTKGSVTTTDWSSYPILRFTEVPKIQVALIDTPNPSGGAGEPPNEVPAGAIGNAIFDATGVRIRQMPFTPARVKAALNKAS
jgi:CO/xanthine dehydrogenase Mo-binding subunit